MPTRRGKKDRVEKLWQHLLPAAKVMNAVANLLKALALLLSLLWRNGVR